MIINPPHIHMKFMDITQITIILGMCKIVIVIYS